MWRMARSNTNLNRSWAHWDSGFRVLCVLRWIGKGQHFHRQFFTGRVPQGDSLFKGMSFKLFYNFTAGDGGSV
jgi:hypothetical protein